MRLILLAPPLLLLCACQVSKDEANDQTTVQFNAQTAENGAEALVDKAEEAAGSVGNAVEKAGATIENKVENIDVDLSVKDKSGGDQSAGSASDRE